jgi:hypothetical protein
MLVLLCLASCGESVDGHRFQLSRVDLYWSGNHLRAHCEQRLQLSPEARDALFHGVPLTIRTELRLLDAATGARLASAQSRHEIRYLPLSEHFQLTSTPAGDVRTFPRLRHVLAELGRQELTFEAGPLPGGQYELLARSYLDTREVPPPMRLPVLFSAAWNHESGWTAWPVEIEPGA